MRTITARFSATLALLIMSVLSLVLIPSTARADGTENYVELAPVYAGGSYSLESLLGYVPDSYTQPDSSESKIVDVKGVPTLKVGFADDDSSLDWFVEHDGTTFQIGLPTYDSYQRHLPKRPSNRFVAKNYYNDPIVVKWYDDVAMKLHKAVGPIAPGASKTISVRKAEVINRRHIIRAFYYVKFRGQKIPVESMSFKVSAKK